MRPLTLAYYLRKLEILEERNQSVRETELYLGNAIPFSDDDIHVCDYALSEIQAARRTLLKRCGRIDRHSTKRIAARIKKIRDVIIDLEQLGYLRVWLDVDEFYDGPEYYGPCRLEFLKIWSDERNKKRKKAARLAAGKRTKPSILQLRGKKVHRKITYYV
jgi:hypothetical protein